jgi:hypothetical protein
MDKKAGSQVSTDDILKGRADSYSGAAELFGVEFELVNGTIKKRDLQCVIQAKVGADKPDRGGVTDRQARAAVSSYVAEGWTDHHRGIRPRINDGISRVSSAAHRVIVHAERACKARQQNGLLGGRPRSARLSSHGESK